MDTHAEPPNTAGSPANSRGAGTPTGEVQATGLQGNMVFPSTNEAGHMTLPPHSLPAMGLPNMQLPGMPPMGGFMNQPGMTMLDLSQQNGNPQGRSQPVSQAPAVKTEPPPGPVPKPPRKPLTPYMRFSKAIWQKVKDANPNMSVCEVGSTIGKMWREMGDTEKQKYNEDFLAAKANYDVELSEYLKVTGLTTADMVKKRDKKKGGLENNAHRRMNKSEGRAGHFLESSKQPTVAQHLQMRNQMNQQSASNQQIQMAPQANFQAQQQFMMGQMNQPGNPSALPHFSQIWTGQNFSPQQAQMAFMMPGLPLPGQQSVQAEQQAGVNGAQAGQQAAPGMVVYPSQAQDGTQVLLTQAGLPGMFQGAGQEQSSGSPSTPTSLNASQPVHQEARSATPQQQQQQQQQAATTSEATLAQQASNPPGWPWHMVPQQMMATTASQGQSPVAEGHASSPAAQEGRAQSSTPQNPLTPSDNRLPNGGSEQHSLAESQPEIPTDQATEAALQQQAASPSSTQESSSAATSATQYNNLGAHYLFSAYGPQGPYGQPPPYNGRPVVSKESVMESELQHLRTALSEKTKEVQRLTQELDKAFETIERLKQERTGF